MAKRSYICNFVNPSIGFHHLRSLTDILITLLQWNLDSTKSLGTGQICSLNSSFVVSKTSTCWIWGKRRKCSLYRGHSKWLTCNIGDFCHAIRCNVCYQEVPRWCNSLNIIAFSVNYFHFWEDMQLLFTKNWNDTLKVAIFNCCNIEVMHKVVNVNKEMGLSVVMLH